MNEQNASMDEILSSIRDIVKEEAGGDEGNDAKAAEKKAAAPAQDPAPTTPPSDADVDDADIDAIMAAEKEAAEDAAEEEADEEDVLELTETVDESHTQATPEEEAAAAMAYTEEEAILAGEPDPAVGETVAPVTVKEDTAPTDPVPATKTKAEEAPKAKAQPANEQVFLNAMPSAKGLQLAFPVEVLAEALRPLVKDWVSQNLPDIVERLVREELSRLVDKK